MANRDTNVSFISREILSDRSRRFEGYSIIWSIDGEINFLSSSWINCWKGNRLLSTFNLFIMFSFGKCERIILYIIVGE